MERLHKLHTAELSAKLQTAELSAISVHPVTKAFRQVVRSVKLFWRWRFGFPFEKAIKKGVAEGEEIATGKLLAMVKAGNLGAAIFYPRRSAAGATGRILLCRSTSR